MTDRAALEKEIERLKAARKKSRSPYLRRDYQKSITRKEGQLKRVKKGVAENDAG